ncbi:unnamed protein product [Vitrella brassicaformis CCMP3155]|uniref:PTHB1 N-terminal domain-containing protein n=2 Tax=Vitrella brassicaformis TaxID=1169539 RepID=A0A0G4ELX0_VITBC|nr:unnamed protein product [Vitrella brassicaformis CCMP3155]|eukprot:CEL98014.1 unnamed protein product [Vitrella brassicaformis CCMP3155]
MSLLAVREYWSTSCGDGSEEFDAGCMCIANVDNHHSGQLKVCVGSYEGCLRIYLPRGRGYTVEDLVLEQHLDMPILQLAAGRFISGIRDVALAVLHPHRLRVYVVSGVSGHDDGHGHADGGAAVSYYSLAVAYEHALTRPAYNMCYGPFGGARDRDLLCVQSLDGLLTFYEQEGFGFGRMLPASYLVPGPLVYSPSSDSFITANANLHVEAFKYSVLGAAASADSDLRPPGDDSEAAERAKAVPRKKLQVDWSVNVGEVVRHIEVSRFSKDLPSSRREILVLGEQTLYVLKDDGAVLTQRRMTEYPMATAACYPLPTPDDGGLDALPVHNLLLGTTTGHVLVFRMADGQLVWAAKLPNQIVPVQMAVAQLGPVPGMIVVLDDAGQLTVTYLGTEPPTSALVNTEMRQLDYAEMEREQQELLQIIRQTHKAGPPEPFDRLVVTPRVPEHLDQRGPGSDEDTEDDDTLARDEGDLVQVTVCVDVLLDDPSGSTYTDGLHNITSSIDNVAQDGVTIAFKTPPAVVPQRPSINIRAIKPNEPVTARMEFRVRRDLLVPNLEVVVSACMVTLRGQPRTAVAHCRLPFMLAAELTQPVHSAVYKLVFDCPSPPSSLLALFDDMTYPQPPASNGWELPQEVQGSLNPHIVSFRFRGGGEGTVLLAKSGRIAIQTSEFAQLGLLLYELERRLQNLRAQETGSASGVLSFRDPLPLHDYFILLDDHFALRCHLRDLRKELEDRTQQYRAVEKRLLVRFRDRNPSPLQHLDFLLNVSYQQVCTVCDGIVEAEKALMAVAQHLTAATHLITRLTKYRFGLDDRTSGSLCEAFSTGIAIEDTASCGWEERCEAAMHHLLKTCLSTKDKERDRDRSVGELSMPEDVGRLKKRITSVIDRLSQGVSLHSDLDPSAPALASRPSITHQNTDAPSVTAPPPSQPAVTQQQHAERPSDNGGGSSSSNKVAVSSHHHQLPPVIEGQDEGESMTNGVGVLGWEG